MAMRRTSFISLAQDASTKAPAARLLPPANARKDVVLSALLEMPTTKQARRSPLEWAGAMGLHLVILVLLIIVPLYTTGTIRLPKFDEVPLVAPPPPPALPAAGTTASPHRKSASALHLYSTETSSELHSNEGHRGKRRRCSPTRLGRRYRRLPGG